MLPQSIGYVVLSCVFALSFYKKRICGWLGSSCHLRYYNIQKILVYYSIVCRVCFESVFDWEVVWVGCYVLFWACFWLRDFGLFVVVVFVIDFTIDWWDGLSCLFWRFVFWMFLIEWLRGLFFLIVWFDWLFRLVVFCWVVVILWERKRLWSDGALQCCRC